MYIVDLKHVFGHTLQLGFECLSKPDLPLGYDLWALPHFGSDLAGVVAFDCFHFHGHALNEHLRVLNVGWATFVGSV